MRAVRFHEYGAPEVLQVEQVDSPALAGPGDVRIAVKAASINPIDWKIRAGLQRGALRYRLPWTLGLDVSGIVLEVGSEVTRFQVGDAVFGSPDHLREGAYAEEVVLHHKHLASKPSSVGHVQAASLPLVGLTAWQCLLPRIAERPGQRVFIQAGSGGVGTFAIQLAKHHGCWVATTCSERNTALVTELGADQVVDYRSQNWWEVLSDLDVILDALGYEERDRALNAVNRGGRVASIVSGLPKNTLRYGANLGVAATGLGMASFALRGRLRGIDSTTVIRSTHADQLEQIAALVDAGAIKPVIDRTFALEEAAAAHAYGETGRIRGKVVLVP